jgi:predicted PolB exonuclease-like 3'-5' exonuclease
VWGLFKQNIGISQLLETGRVMCFSAKWLDKDKIIFKSEFHHGHEETISAAHALISEADALLTFNGGSFDVPMLNREFLKYELLPPAPYAHIDLLLVAKRRFRFTSNKMDNIARELKIARKIQHSGHQLWVDCMNGEKKAWGEMKEYNMQDVVVTEEIYKRFLPWIDTHPNIALYTDFDDPVCTNCGSDDLQHRGTQHNKTLSYKRFQCNDCGTWVRARFPEKRGDKKVLVQIGR